MKAILVDMDDTIITDDAVSEETWLAVCRKFAPIDEGTDAKALRAAIKHVADDYWKDPDNHRKGRLDLKETRREIVRSALSSIGSRNTDMADHIADTYTAEKELAVAPVPGAIETLHSLRRAGLRLALVTNGNSDVQRRKIEKYGLDCIFDYILIEGEFGVGKPDPSVFTTALEKLNVRPSYTWMVGDDLERDIAGAQRLGIRGVWVDWRGTGLPVSSIVRPDLIIRALAELNALNWLP